MSNFVKNYIEGCSICQESKNITHPSWMPLQPTELPSRPFQFITTDFVTDLPESEGYDAILVVVDQFTKTITIEPCNKTIDADTTADILIKRVLCKFGIPEKIISDRGPQFASKVMRTVLKSMGIWSALSTAFHPQTDGATERTNQKIEQFLWAYCHRTQNDWAKLIPYAEMTHNTHQHSSTKKTPNELLFGYAPRWPHCRGTKVHAKTRSGLNEQPTLSLEVKHLAEKPKCDCNHLKGW
jgi:hypothetical protein